MTQKEFEYKKMEMFCVDLFDSKIDPAGALIKDTVSRYGLINGEWIKIPNDCYYNEEFKSFMENNFNLETFEIRDDGKTHIFKRKDPQKFTVKKDDGGEMSPIPNASF